MNYFLFEDGDVVGPFPEQELRSRPGFGMQTLICPQEHSEEESYWKEAQHYLTPQEETQSPIVETVPELSPAEEKVDPLPEEISSTRAAESFLSEMERVEKTFPQWDKNIMEDVSSPQAIPAASLETVAPVVQEATPTAEETAVTSALLQSPAESVSPTPETSLEIISHTENPSPIEEYFNTMRTGDLGNILGIPDPKANSELNLANILEKQLEKTDSVPAVQETDPFDAFTAKADIPAPVIAEKSSANQTEKMLPALQLEQTSVTPENVLPIPTENASISDTHSAAEKETELAEKMEEKLAEVPAVISENTPEKVPTQDSTEPTLNEKSAAILAAVTATPVTKPDEKISVSEEKTEPVVSEEPEKNLHQESNAVDAAEQDTIQPWMVKKTHTGWWIAGGVIGLLLLACVAGLVWRYKPLRVKIFAKPTISQPTPSVAKKETKPATEVKQTAPVPPATVAPQPVSKPVVAEKKPADIAKEVVQQHVLDANRGTIQSYLSKRYAKELAAGYIQSWSAEPLHKQVYVVKYRLAKTRQEPIVYIFQADTAKKKLTGGLNNITLDLVGKIK